MALDLERPANSASRLSPDWTNVERLEQHVAQSTRVGEGKHVVVHGYRASRLIVVERLQKWRAASDAMLATGRRSGRELVASLKRTQAM